MIMNNYQQNVIIAGFAFLLIAYYIHTKYKCNQCKSVQQ